MAAPEESLKALDGLLTEFFAPVTSNERKREIESILQNFTHLSNAWEMCLFFLGSSNNEYVQMFCLNVLETVITHKWMNLPSADKTQIKTQLNQFLLAHHTTVPSYIRNKLAKLVIDIGRSDWPHFYPDFFSSILQLAQQPDTALLGVILLQTASEELASPRDDLSMARKDELQRLLLQQVPAILSVLNNILEAMLEKHRHVIAATPPPSPTSGEGRSKSPRQHADQLFSSSPIANANFVSLLLGSPSRGPQMEALPPLDPAAQQLCWHGLTCLAQYLSWVPLSSVIRPQLLSTIFHFAAFGCQPRPDVSKDISGTGGGNGSPSLSRPGHFSSTTHKLGVLAMNCINEILSKNCVPQEFEDFLLQMFQQTFNLLKKITKESNTSSTGNRLQELDEVYVEKFTDFLRLFVSVHLRRFESNPQFPVLELLSLLFKYTFRQPTTEGYYSCLDIWNTFLDYLTSKLETRAVAREEIINRYKDALSSLMSNILQKLQFRFNQSELEELDDDTLDDDEETEWQHFLRQNLEVVAKVAEVMTADVFQLLWEPFQEYVETYFGVEKFVDNTSVNGRRLCITVENDCRRLHCALRDLSSLLQALGRLAGHFIGETFVLRFENAMQIVTRLVQVMAYGSRLKLFELSTSAAVLQQDFIEVHAQSVAAIKAYSHWMAQFYTETLRTNHQKEEFKNFVVVVMEALIPLIVKEVPEKILQSAAHLLLSITTTVRPAFLLEIACVQALYDKTTRGAILGLPQEIQYLVIRSLSHHLLLPWPNLPETQQNWTQRAAHHKSLVSHLTSQFNALSNLPNLSTSAQEQGKPVIKHTMLLCQDLVKSISGETVRSKSICWESLTTVTQTALTIFPIYIQQTEAIEPIVSYFLAVFQSLKVQMGVTFTEKIMHVFMTVFSRDLLAQTIHQETNVAFRLIENFLKILQLIVQEPGSRFKPFLPQILTLAMDQIYPTVAPRQSPDMKIALFKLLHEILVNNWRYFFKTSVLDSMKKEAGMDTLENSVQFTAILQAYGHSFLQTDISIFKLNLESLESLHFKCKLYNKRIFREVMCHQFLKVLLEVLIRKSHDLLQEEIVISIYNMAASNFDDFFHNFLQQFLTALDGLDNNQKSALAKNFKVDTDLPSFTQTVQRFVNDIRYYNIINASLPAGSVTFS